MTRHRQSPSRITLGGLIIEYRQPSNPRWVDLSSSTRSHYDKVFNWLACYDDLALSDINRATVQQIRDAALAQGTRSIANRVLQVMKLLLNWATENRMLTYNPAASVKLIERPESQPERNRVWTDEECKIMLSWASAGLKAAIALILYSTLPIGDVVVVQWNAYDGTAITHRWRYFVHEELKAILEQTPRTPHTPDTIVTNELGQAYILKNLKRDFKLLRDRLASERKIEPGLTLEGLRRTSLKKKYFLEATIENWDFWRRS
jgi:hypothetical protein